MNHSYIRALAAFMMVALVCSGCQRSRLLSRNDYAELQDPFMDPGATMTASASPSDGVVRVGAESNVTALRGGPKPIGGRPVVRSSNTQVPVARAVYPGGQATRTAAVTRSKQYPGPSLSDFLEPDGQSASKSGIGASSSPSALASEDLQDFARFVDTTAPPAATTPPTSTMTASADQTPDLSKWVEQQKQQWATETQAATQDLAATVPSVPEQAAPGVFGPNGAGTLTDVLPDFANARPADSPAVASGSMAAAAPASDFSATSPAAAVGDNAQPQVALVNDGEAETGVADNDPFQNPFESEPFPPATTPQQAQALVGSAAGDLWQPDRGAVSRPSSPPASLDAAFRMDSGWKPSHLLPE